MVPLTLHDMDYQRDVSKRNVTREVVRRTLPSEARGHPNIPHKACLDDVVKRLHRLLDWRIIIHTVAL